MREIQHFADFIKDTVNLDTTRLDLLEASVETLSAIIRNSDWEPTIQKFVPQGSWAHETIIKPVDGRAFDADLLVLVDPVDGWDAKKYIDELHRVFAGLTRSAGVLVLLLLGALIVGLAIVVPPIVWGGLVGANIIQFDLPFLIHRSWILGVDIPSTVCQFGKWGNFDPLFIDIREWWQLGQRNGCESSLDVMARALGCGCKTEGIDGGNFARLWFGTPEERQQATGYLLNDLQLTADVATRLGVAVGATGVGGAATA